MGLGFLLCRAWTHADTYTNTHTHWHAHTHNARAHVHAHVRTLRGPMQTAVSMLCTVPQEQWED